LINGLCDDCTLAKHGRLFPDIVFAIENVPVETLAGMRVIKNDLLPKDAGMMVSQNNAVIISSNK